MARLARVEMFSPDEIAVVHVMNRVVRRCFLMGKDPVTGKNYDHRKDWVETELKRLAGGFGIDLLCYSVLSNHFHLILRSRPDVVASWDNREVARRWLVICPVNKGGKPLSPVSAEAEVNAICNNPAKLREVRRRLSDISWWMRLLCQRIAQRANREEEETCGKFWQNRYRAVRLIDEAAILACAAYVDLNPIRAGLAEDLESSNYTSVQQRMRAASEVGTQLTPPTEPRNSNAKYAAGEPSFLSSLTLDDRLGPHSSTVSRPTERCSNKGFLSMAFDEYVALLEWAARNTKQRLAPLTPNASLQKLFERLRIKPASWCVLVRNFGALFAHVAGWPHHVDGYRSRVRGQSYRMPRATRELLCA